MVSVNDPVMFIPELKGGSPLRRRGDRSGASHPKACLTAPARKRPLAMYSTPRQNRLLAALPRDDYERLLPDLEPVALPSGWIVHGASDREDYLHFITAGIVSRVRVTDDGAAAEFAATGSEGVIGVASFLGGESTLSQAIALSTVCSYRLPEDLLKTEFERVGPLSHMLLRYTQALIAQTAQIAVCSRHHSLEKRLVRWILSCLDRLSSNELDGDAETDRRVAGSAPRRCSGRAGKAANGGIDPLRPRSRCGPRSLSTGGAGMRVLFGRQERIRSVAPIGKRDWQC